MESNVSAQKLHRLARFGRAMATGSRKHPPGVPIPGARMGSSPFQGEKMENARGEPRALFLLLIQG